MLIKYLNFLTKPHYSNNRKFNKTLVDWNFKKPSNETSLEFYYSIIVYKYLKHSKQDCMIV